MQALGWKELNNKLAEIKAKLKNKQYAEAKKQMDLVEEMNVKSVVLNEMLGDYYHHRKEMKQAKEYWRKALDLWPAYKIDRANLQGKLEQ